MLLQFKCNPIVLLNFFIKWLGCGTFALLFSCICICSKNIAQIYGVSLLVSAVEILLYIKISRATNFGLLHDLNIVSFIKPDNMIATYRNLNLFGEPFNAVIAISTVWLIAFTSFSFIAMIFFSNGRNQEYKMLSFFGTSKHKEKVHGRMHYALKKSLSFHGCLAIIGIWLIAVAFYHIGFTKPASITDFYYKQYTEQCQGNITALTDEIIENERDYFRLRDEKMMNGQMTMIEQNEYQNEQNKREALEQLAYRIDTIRYSNNSEIFYDTGYIRAFGFTDKKETYQLYLLMLILCALTISPIISYDKNRGLTAIIYSTLTGKKSYLKRCVGLASVYSAISIVVVMIPYFINILRKYGCQGISAPIQSIAESSSSLSLNIWQYALLLFIVRGIIIWISSQIMLVVSYNTKSRFTATLINITVFVMPLLITNILDLR